MNKAYRSVWNEVTGTWVAAAETAKARSKGKNSKVIVAALAALGATSQASAYVAGTGASALTTLDTSVGDGAYSNGGGTNYYGWTLGATALGNKASATGQGDVAIGYQALASDGFTTSIGSGSTASAFSASAFGNNSTASGLYATALGINAVASSNSSLAAGVQAVASGAGATALGGKSIAAGYTSLALGNSAVTTTNANNSVAIGYMASVDAANSVALGGNSVANTAAVGTASGVIGGTTYNYAGKSPTGTVSVGSAGAERTITNVAAGQVTAASTDAVNGSQLYAADTQITANTNSITTLQGQMANAVIYDSTAHNSVTLGGVGTSTPVALHNVANGTLSAASTDAVNGSQLNATNANVTSVTNTVNNDAAGQAVQQATQQSAAYTNQQIGIVRKQVNTLGAAAMAASSLIPNARAEGNFQMAVAAGTYGGESALALGANWYVSDRVLLNAHVSKSTGGGSTGASVGATIGF